MKILLTLTYFIVGLFALTAARPTNPEGILLCGGYGGSSTYGNGGNGGDCHFYNFDADVLSKVVNEAIIVGAAELQKIIEAYSG